MLKIYKRLRPGHNYSDSTWSIYLCRFCSILNGRQINAQLKLCKHFDDRPAKS